MLVTPLDLIHMTAMQAQALPDLCTLRAVAMVTDGSGGWAEGTTDTSDVPCRLSFTSGGESVQGEQVVAQRNYQLTIPATYTLTPTMRIVKAGIVYSVLSVNEGASYATATRATLARVEV